MIRIVVLAIVFLYFQLNGVFSQTTLIDSFYNEVSTWPLDSNLSHAYIKLSSDIRFTDPKASIELAKEAFSIAQKIKFEKDVIRATYTISVGFYMNSNVDSSLYYALLSEEYSNSFNNYRIGDIYNLIGVLYNNNGKSQGALEYGFKSVKYFEELNDEKGAATAYINVGNIFWETFDYENAKKYLIKGKDIFVKYNDSLSLCSVYSNLFSLAKSEDKLNYLKKAEAIAFQLNKPFLLGHVYSNYGGYYLDELNDFKKAKYYYTLTKKYADLLNDLQVLAQLYNGLGHISFKEEKMDSSIYFYKLSITYAKANRDKFKEKDVCYRLSKAYKDLPNLDSAYHYLELFSELRDSLYNEDINVKMQEANAKYETEKKDDEIAKQELEIVQQKANKTIIIGGGILILMAASSIFFWYYGRQKRKKKETEVVLVKKQLEAQKFKELDAMKNQFFTNITHELRTPLTLIMGPLVNALEKSDNPALSKDLHLAQNNTHRLLDMINEILDLSKLESGNIPINEDIVASNQFFRRILFSFQSIAEMNHIELAFESDLPANTSVILDIEKIETILNNLLSNALKYSPINGTIKLSLIKNNHQLIIKVQDNGVGIPKNEQEHIFNRFYQASNTDTKTQGGGTGVGLALSKSLSKLMNGDLTVESELGKGSCFKLTIPTKYRQAQDKNVTDESIKDTKTYYDPILFNGEKPKILIIEDNIEMQEFLRDILQTEYKITIANDGYDGLKKLQTSNFDLVSCDVMMPKMDGFTLKEKTNELKLIKDIPFIFLTAKVLKEDRLRGLRLGVDDYITKPFIKQEYKARIYNLLHNRKSRLDYLSLNTDYALQDMDTVEQQILKKAELLIHKKVSDPSLKVNDLAAELNYSQRQLTRVIKKLTGMTAVQFILELRLQRAYQLLQSKSYTTVNEVMYEVGIESASYFTRKFKERFGLSAGKL